MQILNARSYFQVPEFDDLRTMIDRSVRLHGDRIAFRFRRAPRRDIETRTYARFREETDALGTALLALGLGGRRIAVIGENSYGWCLAHTAILNGVGVSVPLDRLLPEEEILALLECGEVDAVFHPPSFEPVLRRAAARLPRLKWRICIDRSLWQKDSDRPAALSFPDALDLASDRACGEAPAGVGKGAAVLLEMEDLLDAGAARLAAGDRAYLDAPLDPDALASLLFTSGTTSLSKAVMLSHRNLASDIRGMAQIIDFAPGTRLLSVLPLHHTFENTCGLFMALHIGGEICEADGLRYIQQNMQEYRIQLLIGVPLLFENFHRKLQEGIRKQGKERSVRIAIRLARLLRRLGIDVRPRLFAPLLEAFGGAWNAGICGAAPIEPAVLQFFDDIGVRIYQGYGLTETSPVVAGCNARVFVPGTVGHPIGGATLAVDAERPGDPGEILVRGPMVMKGYYQDEAATAEAIRDGWFHTGDIGQVDRRGHLRITGRLKSMIVLRNGKKVFPEEIEHLVGQSPMIRETLVWGNEVPDGEVEVCARFVLDMEEVRRSHGDGIDEPALRTLLDRVVAEANRHLPQFKTIRYYVFGFTEMIKTTTLKIKRPVEIDRIRQALEQASVQLREFTGHNIDPLLERLAPTA